MGRTVWIGVGLFALAQAALLAESALVHALGAEVAPSQLSFLRGLALLAIAALLAARTRGTARAMFRTARPGRHALHGAAVVAMLWPMHYGVAHLPLADSAALSYLRPVFLAVFAALFLAERVAPARWAAVLLGFAGCLAVLGPAFAEWHAAYGAAVLAAMLSAFALAVGGGLARADGVAPTLAGAGLALALGSLPFALDAPWHAEHAWALAGITACGAALTTLSLLAAQRAPLSLLAPLDYARLPFAMLAGFAVFAQVPGPATFAGAALILAAGAATWAAAPRRAGGAAKAA